MPKSKFPAILLSCDICDFKATNRYIFKRHRHRCLTIHGIASKSSTSRNPLRLKGTEDLLVKKFFSQSKISNSPLLFEEDEKQNIMETSTHQSQKAETVEEMEKNGITDLYKEQDLSIDEGNESIMDTGQQSRINDSEIESRSSGNNTLTPYSRNYKCDECDFTCRSSREHLYHLRDIHSHPGPIFECKECDYCTRYQNKVSRHMAVHKRSQGILSTTDSEVNFSTATKNPENKDVVSKLVTPLKLKLFGKNTWPGFRLEKKSKLKDYVKLVVSEDGSHSYQCKDCLYYSQRIHNVKKHHILCHSKVLVCPHCNEFQSTSQGAYYEHLLTHTERNYMKCTDCSYVTHAKTNFEKHRSFHEGQFPFKCKECNFGADSINKIKRHMATQHCSSTAKKESPVEKSSDGLTKEMTNGDLLDDMNIAKEQDSKEENNEGQSKEVKYRFTKMEFRCPRCPMVCYRRGNFTKHLTTKHKISLINASVLSKSMERQGQSKKKRSIFSKSTFKQKSITFQNVGEGIKCSYCSYTTKWESDLRRHMNMHTIVKRYKCSLCSNKYKYHGDLKVHLRRDHNTKPLASMYKKVTVNAERKASPSSFRCPICSFITDSKAKLEKHTRLHGDIEKTYQCRICSYQTYWRGDVSRHLYKHHNLVVPRDGSGGSDYFIHRPEIQPITKRSTPMINKSLSSTQSSGTNLVKFNDQQVLTIDAKPEVLKQRSLICEYSDCQYKASTPEKMEEHVAVHMNIKLFMCPICGKRTNWRWDIVKHMAKVHSKPGASREDVIMLSTEEAKSTIEEYLRSAPVNKFAKKGSKDISYKTNYSDAVTSSIDEVKVKTEILDTIDVVSKFEEPSAEDLMKYELPFACALCNKLGNCKGNIKKHYNYAHPYKEVRIIYRPTGVEFNFETGNICQKSTIEPIEQETDNPGSSDKGIKPDSKYSNPKMHGYVKPFKCSICGLRSNWKWDLKKHLRSKHSNQGGFVIMLSIEEAQQTYGTECSLSHPKHEDFLAIPSQNENLNNGSNKATPTKHTESKTDVLFKKVKQKSLNNSRLWKCSGCKYITTWRRNILRHIRRKHKHENPSEMPLPVQIGNANRIIPTEKDFRSEESSNLDSRIWQCQECSFTTEYRPHIVVHMQKHGLKPFKCGICGVPFMSRGNVHRHVRQVHDMQTDYLKICKLNIKYDTSNDTSNHESALVYYWLCRLCDFESAFKASVLQHLQDTHSIDDPKFIGKGKKKTSVTEKNLDFESHLRADPERSGKKYHFCKLCPFRSPKKSILAFHMTYHRPSAINKMKCKFCNYYVNTTRLLHQHQRKWHTDSPAKIQRNHYQVERSKKKSNGSGITGIGKLRCEKCPYTTSSRNDFIYHKQFHRPKRNAEFKCEYCDYWVVHKRLLKQHMRLHEESTNPESGSADISPVKIFADPSYAYDPAELSELVSVKQKIISDKISASLSEQPTISPMKLASRCSTDDRPGYVLKNGVYRKLHKCHLCPYTNVRSRNMNLHKMMHGPRSSPHPLMKCPHCDYYVGSKGLLSHHMKVHQKSYNESFDIDGDLQDTDDLDDFDVEIGSQQKVDTLLQISRFKKFGCEKCPFASGKRSNFERHLELHGSRQRYSCQFCDYSVPSNSLLQQHTKLHLMPNQNLLLSQSMQNLQQLSDVPADVALASALPPADAHSPVTISIVHDHLGLYENGIMDAEPKKLYRCDRCPYANIRRDYLLSHLKFHMVSNSLLCPYCDYSAPKQALLTQHIRVHFCPLPELTDWVSENVRGNDTDESHYMDIEEVIKSASDPQVITKDEILNTESVTFEESPNGKSEESENLDLSLTKKVKDIEFMKEDCQVKKEETMFICQYCDREFHTSEKLVSHELQHLVGNNVEKKEYMSRIKKLDKVMNGGDAKDNDKPLLSNNNKVTEIDNRDNEFKVTTEKLSISSSNNDCLIEEELKSNVEEKNKKRNIKDYEINHVNEIEQSLKNEDNEANTEVGVTIESNGQDIIEQVHENSKEIISTKISHEGINLINVEKDMLNHVEVNKSEDSKVEISNKVVVFDNNSKELIKE